MDNINATSTTPFVAILMGSSSDWDTMKSAASQLSLLGIACESHVLSAHRSPEETMTFVKTADKKGCAVFIAGAGLAAHLAGCIASHTVKPVIGVPLSAGTLGGLDALLSTVQMPPGVPVACTAIGKPGAKNAALLAAQILALQDKRILEKLTQLRLKKREELKETTLSL